MTDIERFACDDSDIISYHNYGTYQSNVMQIKRLWMDLAVPSSMPVAGTLPAPDTVQEMFPLFYLEKIGCYNWGFVAGKYQTYEPWEGLWQRYEKDHQRGY